MQPKTVRWGGKNDFFPILKKRHKTISYRVHFVDNLYPPSLNIVADTFFGIRKSHKKQKTKVFFIMLRKCIINDASPSAECYHKPHPKKERWHNEQ